MTHRPAHGAVALAGDGVALAQVLTGAEVRAVRPVLSRRTGFVAPTNFTKMNSWRICLVSPDVGGSDGSLSLN